MIRLVNRRLIIPRGDTGSFSIPVLVNNNDADKVAVFSIIDPLTQSKILDKRGQINDTVIEVEFNHSDTVNLPVGSFLWDIKFYINPVIADGKLIDGEEIDSYYAAYSLPACEIRQTGDDLLVSDDSPAATMAPDQIDIISSAMAHINTVQADVSASRDSASASATAADASATAASTSASAAANSAGSAELAQQVATQAATNAATSASEAAASAAQIEVDLETKANVADLSAVAFSGDYTDLSNVPTDLGDFTNTPGYLTQHQDISGKANSADLATVATSGEYSDLLHTPTNVSSFTNDAGYLTQHQDISMKANSADLATVATSGSYNDLSNKPFIPSAVSDLTDDSGHYTKPVTGIPASDLEETYLTSFTETDPTVPSWAKAQTKPTYTASEVGAPTVAEMNTAISNAIGNVHQFNVEIVQSLPITGIKEHTVYFVPKTGETNDVYDEYIRINDAWEMIGNTQIDLSNYATKSELPVNVSELTNDAGYLTVHQDISGKADKTDTVLLTTLSRGRTPSSTVGTGSYAFGAGVTASGDYSHAEGSGTNASGENSHAEGGGARATAQYAHAEGAGTQASGQAAHAENGGTTASGAFSHAEGSGTSATDMGAHSEGGSTIASGSCSHAEGGGTHATSDNAHAEGGGTYATAPGAHAEGSSTHADGTASHAEGEFTYATGGGSHAEGANSYAVGDYAHAEGGSHANGMYSHTEGVQTIANGAAQHVSGLFNVEDSYNNWNEWTANTSYSVGDKVKVTTTNNGETTVVGYNCITANNDASFTSAKWEPWLQMNFAEIIGNGSNPNARSNAFALDWNGNGHYMGDVYVGANANSTGGTKVLCEADFATDLDIQNIINGGAGA